MSTARTLDPPPTASDATYCCWTPITGSSCGCPYTNCTSKPTGSYSNMNIDKSDCVGNHGAIYCDRDNPSNSSCSCTMTAPTSTACSVTSPIS